VSHWVTKTCSMIGQSLIGYVWVGMKGPISIHVEI